MVQALYLQQQSEVGARTFFALASAKQNIELDAKNESESAKKNEARVKAQTRAFSSLCRITPATRFQSPNPLGRGKIKGLEKGVWLSLLLFHAAYSCCMSVLHVRGVSCPCCMPMLHAHTACPSCMPMLHVHAACPCWMPKLRVHTACARCRSMLPVHAACPCYVSMLRVLLY